ncbi:MAG: SUMF1/EgtB/PvdO family nonheme iron enzyme [Chloroflexi bacterium]|nr:SUMF1/EgtB/PvdO family nonheme iron enzyme [Chloroflexota bacterium]
MNPDFENHSNLRQQLRASLRQWRTRLTRLGGDSLYLFLSAAAFAPAAVALAQGQPAGVELMMLLGSLGGNLLANVVQKFRDAPDEAAAAALLQEALAQTPALQAELDALLAKLEVFTTAQEELPEPEHAWFAKTLRAELEQRGNWPQFQAQFMAVGPGAQVIDNRGGLIIQQGNQSVIHIIQQAGAPEPERDALWGQIGRYLAWVQDKYGTIELRGIKREGQQVMQLALETVYVPLAATLYQRQATGRHRDEMAMEIEKPVDIAMQQLLDLDHRLIVTGGPGCGKTTVLLHIAWALAQALADDDPALVERQLGLRGPLPLPIFIPLSTYALYLRELPRSGDPQKRTLAAYISHYLIESQAGFDLPPDFFQELLRQGEAVILLLDGLDEVPNETERVKVRQAIENLVTGRENMRVVVTCRTAAYQGRTALGKGFREVKVKPLEAPHIQALVEQAYRHIYRTDPTMQAKKSAELLAGIDHLEAERRRRLGKDAPQLVGSPLMVRLLLIVHYSERRRLPEQRAELYMKATDAMLLPDYAPDEDVTEQIGRAVGGSMEIHRDLMQHLAFHMHQKGEKQGREVSEATLREMMVQEPLYAGMVDDLIALARVRGTLLEERMGMYRFLHLAFQEYLAARYLAEIMRGVGGVAAIAEFLEQGPLLDSWWREVALLTPGYLMVMSAPTAQLLLQRLAGLDKEVSARTLPADVELAAAEIAATAFWEWGAPRPELQDMQTAIRQKLTGLLADRERAAQSKPPRRAAVGVAVAHLGDPRPEVMDVDAMQFCYVPPGPFWMGSDDGESNEKPQHWVEMPHAYWLSRFPVTNAQYALFMEEGGYATERYWSEAREHGVWEKGKVKGFVEDEPRNWPVQFGHPFDLPNHPVVGVMWYEALAYTRWLTERWREWLPDAPEKWGVRLPTEAEWEKGARGGVQIPAQAVIQPIAALRDHAATAVLLRENPHNQAVYIWGSAPDANRANYKESGIGSSSAVGCFPGGVSPYGLEEMAGNVWEWLHSKHKGYEYRADDGREVVDASGDIRMLRGGSYSSDQYRMRCAPRYGYYVHYGGRDGGFRVCVSPFLSSL